MTFQDFNMSLGDDCVYVQADLDGARRIFNATFELLAPEWPAMPRGELGRLWLSDSAPSVLRLIEVAKLINQLSRNISEQSVPIFHSKILQLLTLDNRVQFVELISELRVGTWLANMASPVVFEPLVRPFNSSPRTQPKSPDYSIRIPGGDVDVEATTFRIDAFDKWRNAVDTVAEKLRSATARRGLIVEVVFTSDISFRASGMERRAIELLADAMTRRREDRIAFSLCSHSVEVEWREISIIEILPGEDVLQAAERGLAGQGNIGVSALIGKREQFRSAWSFRRKLRPSQGSENLVLRSLTNTIRGKREQLRHSEQGLIVFQTDYSQDVKDHLAYLIQSRVWPKGDYKWLTGIGLMEPQVNYSRAERLPRVLVTLNPSATWRATPALQALVEGTSSFRDGVQTSAH